MLLHVAYVYREGTGRRTLNVEALFSGCRAILLLNVVIQFVVHKETKVLGSTAVPGFLIESKSAWIVCPIVFQLVRSFVPNCSTEKSVCSIIGHKVRAGNVLVPPVSGSITHQSFVLPLFQIVPLKNSFVPYLGKSYGRKRFGPAKLHGIQ